MGQINLPGNPPIPVILRRSARARRLSLRLSRLDGRVTLTLPKGVSEAEGRDFVLSKESWLRAHLDQQQAEVPVTHGALLPLHGADLPIRPGSGRAVRLTETALEVPGHQDQVPRRVQAFVKTLARDRLAEASDRYSQALGRPYTRLTLRDTRSRWGSCTADGGLMYSWRLILAPPAVLDYVAAHEVAHLAEMNHSPAFWAVVERLYGDWKAPRRWLRTQGPQLHRYRFD
ncbi:M48 family metallopeptidase [Tropicibacter oceani]|uniref:SprT family zinc-dependent metalloprotease n=1 Tax=Tropicibacter oceani TaxID=3058420 RepID=A0ABY8QK59_9RHOB|nr:SprT family zinc-dependent metalloprotease [Tropicibacter oceani]WGW05021.1 SprT family zinc-dependent metalloprotease [Tropicibacter oceani]